MERSKAVEEILKSMRSATAKEALGILLQGNQRFVSGQNAYPNQSLERRTQLLEGQHPFAIVLTCSDSRVPPEVIFDQGLGDIFVVRTAGNVLDEIALGSIEYAVEHLKVPLILVMGHQKCGAVSATAAGGEAPGHIASVVEKIMPAVEQARSLPGDLVTNAIDLNIKLITSELRSSEPILLEFVKSSQLEVVGSRYDLDSGLVTLR